MNKQEVLRQLKKMKRQLAEGQNILPSREELIEICEVAIKAIEEQEV